MIKRLLVALALSLPLLPQAAAAQAAEIPFVGDINLNVGQSVIFYGYVGECGQVPAQVRLPQLRTGTLSVGAVGQRSSRRCGGMTTAVEIIFTATTPGRENFRINEDRFTARVRN